MDNKIMITFAADNVPDLLTQLQNVLGMMDRGSPAPVPVDPAPEAKKPRKAPVAAPVAEAEPLTEVSEDVAPKLVEADTAKAMLKLKDETIAKLQQAFADGKVKKLRALLEDHGGGAKSFPEVAIENFPKIAQQIESGALA